MSSSFAQDDEIKCLRHLTIEEEKRYKLMVEVSGRGPRPSTGAKRVIYKVKALRLCQVGPGGVGIGVAQGKVRCYPATPNTITMGQVQEMTTSADSSPIRHSFQVIAQVTLSGCFDERTLGFGRNSKDWAAIECNNYLVRYGAPRPSENRNYKVISLELLEGYTKLNVDFHYPPEKSYGLCRPVSFNELCTLARPLFASCRAFHRQCFAAITGQGASASPFYYEAYVKQLYSLTTSVHRFESIVPNCYVAYLGARRCSW